MRVASLTRPGMIQIIGEELGVVSYRVERMQKVSRSRSGKFVAGGRELSR